jgi:UDP-glucose 4-epimerase
MVLPNFVRQAIEGRPLTVYGDGNQSRCFCHVSDVVGALSQLSRVESALGGVFNLGSDEEITILKLAHRVKDFLKSDSPIEMIPYEEAYGVGFEDMSRRVPDLSKLHNLTGYRPTKTIDDIIESVSEYQRAVLAASGE